MSTSPSSIPMIESESIRKIHQLQPVLHPDGLTRGFVVDDVLASDLAAFVKDGKFDDAMLMPFVISAIQNLDKRLNALERRA